MAADALEYAKVTAANARLVLWKLAKSTGKAAWITATSGLILLVPLIIEMDREQQLVEFETQQLGALTGGSAAAK
jgi:import receptor subunit TOM22